MGCRIVVVASHLLHTVHELLLGDGSSVEMSSEESVEYCSGAAQEGVASSVPEASGQPSSAGLLRMEAELESAVRRHREVVASSAGSFHDSRLRNTLLVDEEHAGDVDVQSTSYIE